jgi:hypothetical protein
MMKLNFSVIAFRAALKGQSHEIFDPRQTITLDPLIHGLKPFRI